MLSNLFKPAWQSSSAEKRAHFAETADPGDTAQLAALKTLAMSDQEPSVRAAALARLDNPAWLTNAEPSDEISQHLATIMRVAQPEHQEDWLQFLATSLAQSMIVQLAGRCSLPEVRAAALAQIQDQERFSELLELSEFSDTRHAVAARLTDLEQLDAAWKIARKRDKNLAHELKKKLDQARAEHRLQQESLMRQQQICDAAELLAAAAWTPQYNSRFQALATQWQQLPTAATEDNQATFDQATERCQQTIEAHAKVADAMQIQSDVVATLEQFVQELLATATHDLAADSELRAPYQLLLIRWSESLDLHRADTELLNRYANAVETIEAFFESLPSLRLGLETLDALAQAENLNSTRDLETQEQAAATGLTPENPVSAEESAEQTLSVESLTQTLLDADARLKWPARFPAWQGLAEFKTRVDGVKRAQREARQQAKARSEAVLKQIGSLRAAIRRGDLRVANAIFHRLRDKVEALAEQERVVVQERFNDATEELGKMSDWRDFATTPKFEDLCQRMEGLISVENIHPSDLSKRIQALQEEWKHLQVRAPDALWERFQTAAKSAFAPCQAWFDDQKKIRSENAEACRVINQQLEELIARVATDSPDWKAALHQRRELNDLWRKHKDLDYKRNQALLKRNKQLQDQLQAAFSAEYAANIERKRMLLQSVNSMLEAEFSPDMLEQVKTLQAKWKTVGIMPRGEDQALWKQFRAGCDELFARRQAQHQATVEVDRENERAARAVIAEFRALAKDVSDVAEVAQKRESLEATYQALPALYEKAQMSVDRDYQAAQDELDQALAARAQRAKDANLESLEVLAEQVQSLERAKKTATPEAQELSQTIEQSELASDWKRILIARLAAEISTVAEADAHRLLCIQLEIILGKESPAADKTLRLNYQMAQLKSRGLGQQDQRGKAQKARDLRIQWLLLPAPDASQANVLQRRFSALISAV